MREHRELFRIFVNSVRYSRDAAEERQSVTHLERTIQHILAPEGIRGRLHYGLEIDHQTYDQWLVVACSESLQRELFERRTAVVPSSLRHDHLAESTAVVVTDALKLLQQFSQQARWQPDDFFEAIRASHVPGINLLTSRDDGLTLMVNGESIMAQSIQLPRRTLLRDAVTVVFRVDMVGTDKARVELVKHDRSRLQMPNRYAMLSWHALEQPTVYNELRLFLESGNRVNAEVYPLVDRRGRTIDFALDRLQ